MVFSVRAAATLLLMGCVAGCAPKSLEPSTRRLDSAEIRRICSLAPGELGNSGVEIGVSRSSNYGPTLISELTIRADGTVIFSGLDGAALSGAHSWRIPSDRVCEMLTRMEQSGFFELGDRYLAHGTDADVLMLRVIAGDRVRTVVSTSNGDPSDPKQSVQRQLQELSLALERDAGVFGLLR